MAFKSGSFEDGAFDTIGEILRYPYWAITLNNGVVVDWVAGITEAGVRHHSENIHEEEVRTEMKRRKRDINGDWVKSIIETRVVRVETVYPLITDTVELDE